MARLDDGSARDRHRRRAARPVVVVHEAGQELPDFRRRARGRRQLAGGRSRIAAGCGRWRARRCVFVSGTDPPLLAPGLRALDRPRAGRRRDRCTGGGRAQPSAGGRLPDRGARPDRDAARGRPACARRHCSTSAIHRLDADSCRTPNRCETRTPRRSMRRRSPSPSQRSWWRHSRRRRPDGAGDPAGAGGDPGRAVAPLASRICSPVTSRWR